MSENPTPVSRARELRQKMTASETMLWQELRNRRFFGLKFNRQFPLIYQVVDNEPSFFIADFFCHEKQLIIEVDGAIHEFQKARDEHREDILKSMGFYILRIRNEETEDMEKLKGKIREFIEKIEKFPDSPPAPLSREGSRL